MASINLSSFAGAGAQFFDNNGVPLVGGLLYVYTAGTTTPATTWTTSSGTVSNTNPVVLDAGGRTPNEIWVNGGVLYKFVLKNSSGVTIGTYDNIPAIDDPTAFNNIITVTGTNTLIGTSTPPNTAYTRGMTLSFVVVNTNTGAVTIDVDGLGAKEITIGSSPLSGGELVAGRITSLEYDGTRFQVAVAYVPDASITTAKLADASITSAKMANGGAEFGMRNRIINGNMSIDQRNAGASVTIGATTSQYTIDRWFAQSFAANKFSVQQNAGAVTPPTGFKNYLGVTSLAATTPGSTDYYSLIHAIEGLNFADLAWGTSSAAPITVTFSVRSSLTGSFSASVCNSANTRCYPFSYSISAANTWEQKTVTIPGDTTGTWLTDNNTGLYLRFDLGCGSSYKGTANAWAATNYYGVTGAVSVVGTNGATFYVTGVQLEKGSTATPFEYRPYSTELALCQRYLPAIQFSSGRAYGANACQVACAISTPPRVSPSGVLTLVYPTLSGSGTTQTANSVVFAGANTSGVVLNLTSASNFGAVGDSVIQYNGTLFGLGCEL